MVRVAVGCRPGRTQVIFTGAPLRDRGETSGHVRDGATTRPAERSITAHGDGLEETG
jgi:hypothetical protein